MRRPGRPQGWSGRGAIASERGPELVAGATGPELEPLIGACARGERSGLRELYARMAPELYAVAVRMLRRPELAQDAVHDAFVQVWERAASFDPARGSARGWLVAIVRYRSLDMLRRMGRRRDDLDVEEIVLADPGADPAERLGLGEDAARLRRCLDGLSQQARQCILLAHVRGYTHDELAARLERPVGTIKSWIRRGLAMLRICLES